MKIRIEVPYRLYMWVVTQSLLRRKLVSRFFYWVASHLSTCIPAFRVSKPVTVAHLIEDVHPIPKSHKGRSYGEFVIRPRFSGGPK